MLPTGQTSETDGHNDNTLVQALRLTGNTSESAVGSARMGKPVDQLSNVWGWYNRNAIILRLIGL
jgi:hypothetical protein